MSLGMFFGVYFSGDTGQELAMGLLGLLLLGLPGLFGAIVYLPAGLGLLFRRAWGYYFHLAGAVLAALTCVGVIYTIPALLFALRPEFTMAFFRSNPGWLVIRDR
jgi:hypothetical protein